MSQRRGTKLTTPFLNASIPSAEQQGRGDFYKGHVHEKCTISEICVNLFEIATVTKKDKDPLLNGCNRAQKQASTSEGGRVADPDPNSKRTLIRMSICAKLKLTF